MVNFRFNGGHPASEQFIEDFLELGKLSPEAVLEFSALVAQNLMLEANGQGGLIQDAVREFADREQIRPSVVKSALRGLLELFAGAIKTGLSLQHVGEDILAAGLDETRARAICKVWKKCSAPLSSIMVGQTMTINRLVDLDWKFGITASCSEVKKVGSTFLQLKLTLDKGNSKTEDVFMELTLPQFYEFLSQIEMAKKALDTYS
eukprot:GCRY01001399.1.p1 GENE.GCRY01001399.1~~GCRY01001399.1.p1  ORF type:complete len:205 (+),score=13.41 GCRY01001399.1:232-846(+)